MQTQDASKLCKSLLTELHAILMAFTTSWFQFEVHIKASNIAKSREAKTINYSQLSNRYALIIQELELLFENIKTSDSKEICFPFGGWEGVVLFGVVAGTIFSRAWQVQQINNMMQYHANYQQYIGRLKYSPQGIYIGFAMIAISAQ